MGADDGWAGGDSNTAVGGGGGATVEEDDWDQKRSVLVSCSQFGTGGRELSLLVWIPLILLFRFDEVLHLHQNGTYDSKH